MSRDRPPLMAKVSLGALRPASKALDNAITSLGNGAVVEVTIKRAKPNNRRLNLYWAIAAKAAENWPMEEGEMTSGLLHRRTKEQLGIGKTVKTKTGEEIFDADSIAFSDMTEDQRAAYIDAALALWSSRLGVDAQTLLEEAKRDAA